jgi:hypothetical protein
MRGNSVPERVVKTVYWNTKEIKRLGYLIAVVQF